MKDAGYCAAAFLAMASALSADGPDREASGPTPATAAHLASSTSRETFRQYCVVCHGGDKPQAGLSLARLTERMAPADVGAQADTWQKVADMLETRQMPPAGMPAPTEAERARLVSWIRASLGEYDAGHGGDPGRVTVRRLTSAEYAYAIRDLTGVEVKVGVDASSDSVGGEGFANFGDVQFVQDAVVERYLEAAKQVADHAVIGSGPLAFYTDPGKTGLELSALDRIDELYRDARVPRRLGRGRPSLRLRALRQGVLRRLALQAPRGPRRSGGDLARPRGEGRHHRPLRRAHLRSGQPDRRPRTRAAT